MHGELDPSFAFINFRNHHPRPLVRRETNCLSPIDLSLLFEHFRVRLRKLIEPLPKRVRTEGSDGYLTFVSDVLRQLLVHAKLVHNAFGEYIKSR